MKVFLMACAFILMIGCSAKVTSKGSGTSQVVVPDEPPPPITKESLVDQLKKSGTYLGAQTSLLDRDYEVVSTTEDEKYFVTGNKVVSSSRKPKAGEQTLMYWRNYFKGKLYRETRLKIGHQGHTRPNLRLTCDSMGQGVLYDPSHELVTRVFYYEKK